MTRPLHYSAECRLFCGNRLIFHRLFPETNLYLGGRVMTRPYGSLCYEILHKISFVLKTPIVKIGVFLFFLQDDRKKAAKRTCILVSHLLQ